MAYSGPWGTFIHVPKTGGTYVNKALSSIEPSRKNGLGHGWPTNWRLDPFWMNIREPIAWWNSFWRHRIAQNFHDYPHSIPWQALINIVEPYLGGDHETVCKRIIDAEPGIIEWYFNAYRLPRVQVVKMEEMDTFLEKIPGITLPDKPHNVSPQPKLVFSQELQNMIKTTNINIYKEFYPELI